MTRADTAPELQVFPPDGANEALLKSVPGVRETPIPVVGFDGPAGQLGPEAAGAVLVLHMTMADPERTQAFWRQVALTSTAASAAPGFIRMMAFFDGAANWAIGLWRTAADARAFAKGQTHTAAIAEMEEKQFEYTHFAGLFEAVEARPRHVYCLSCGQAALMPVDACPACGAPVADVFRGAAASTHLRMST